MKRLAILVLALMLMCTSAFAMEKAASQPDWDRLERYASFDEDGTLWSVRSNQGAAALARMAAEEAPYTGYASFGLELMGDQDTGLVVPVLTVYYAGAQKLNGTVVSIAANGMRYDLSVCRESITLGANKGEKLTAPLNAEGLDMIRAMLSAEEVNVWLIGDMTFKMTPKEKKFYASSREELSGRSLKALEDMLNEFDAMGGYELWDLNEEWWIRTRGVKPEMNVVTLPADKKEVKGLAVEVEKPMYMLTRGEQGDAARSLQKLLISAGYIQGTADGGYGEDTVRAVRAAQTWLGLMPTGCADETLIRLLSEDVSMLVSEEIAAMETTELYTAEGLCEMSIERFWFADAVESQKGERRTVADRDNTLIIYEGNIKNLSVKDLDFYWQMSANVKYGEYTYPCVLVCERNEGASFSSALTPLGEARLIVYAEIPENIAGDGEWALEITAEDQTFLFE